VLPIVVFLAVASPVIFRIGNLLLISAACTA
jgi:hypothetical protein